MFTFLTLQENQLIINPFFEELEAQDCSVVAVAGSVAKLEDVERAVAKCPTQISGVIQMPMVLRVSWKHPAS